MDFSNKHFFITGASSGIGKALAIYLSERGARLTITGRNLERLAQTLESLTGEGHISIVSDLSNVEDIDAMFKTAIDRQGVLDGCVHCAGLQKTLPLQSVSSEAYDDLFNVNVKSALFIAKSFRRKGVANPVGASLVFLSSVAALAGEPAISIYSASKGALISLARSLAVELARQKIRVNCIAPGVVDTDMADGLKAKLSDDQYNIILKKHPLGLGTVNDVSSGVAFLLSDGARWVTGTTLVMDGGYTAG